MVADLQACGDSPVFVSHLPTSVQGEITDACTTMSSFYIGSGNANQHFRLVE